MTLDPISGAPGEDDAADALLGPQEGSIRTGGADPEADEGEIAGDAGAGPEAEEEYDPGPLLRSGIPAREASQRGLAVRRANSALAERSQPGDLTRHVRVPVNVSATVRKLAKEAQRGSTHASRELRAWMDVLEADTPSSVSELDARTRQRLLTRLLVEIEDDE